MNQKTREIEVSNAELESMVRDLDEINNDVSVAAMDEAGAALLEQVHEDAANEEGLKSRRLGRRTFILGAGAVAGGLALAACGSSTPSSTPSTTATTASNTETASDLALTALATSLENQAVTTYNGAVNAVLADKFGNIPKAATNFALVARTQHQAHAAAWNDILVAAGKSQVSTGPSAGPYSDSIVAAKLASIVKAGNLVDLLELALLLEGNAAQSYQVVATAATTTKGIQLAASIQPVEMQHCAILYFVLGKYPGVQSSSGTPLAFNPTTNASMTTYYTGPI